ncbi:unnamed protein product [Pedinophyceae sp. YPF-701]|nr:unnamed protein product [Pedinophyceae sp. YPF-701]
MEEQARSRDPLVKGLAQAGHGKLFASAYIDQRALDAVAEQDPQTHKEMLSSGRAEPMSPEDRAAGMDAYIARDGYGLYDETPENLVREAAEATAAHAQQAMRRAALIESYPYFHPPVCGSDLRNLGKKQDRGDPAARLDAAREMLERELCLPRGDDGAWEAYKAKAVEIYNARQAVMKQAYEAMGETDMTYEEQRAYLEGLVDAAGVADQDSTGAATRHMAMVVREVMRNPTMNWRVRKQTVEASLEALGFAEPRGPTEDRRIAHTANAPLFEPKKATGKKGRR